MAQKTSKTSRAKATKRGASTRVGIIRSSKRPGRNAWTVLYAFIFAAVFAWLGHYLFFSKAESILPTGSDQIVFQFEKIGSTVTQRLADGSVVNLMQPEDVLLTGDGTLYCNLNASPDGTGSTVTKTTLTDKEMTRAYRAVSTPDVARLSMSQQTDIDSVLGAAAVGAVPSASGATDDEAGALNPSPYSNLAVLIINGNDQALTIYNQGDTTGIFTRTSVLVRKLCTDRHPTTPVNALPVLQDPNLPQTASSKVDNLLSTFGILGHASAAVTADTTSENNDQSHVQTHRYYHYPYQANYTRTSCLNSIARSWAYHMAVYRTLSHNPNLTSQISSKCGYWYAAAENVGTGPSEYNTNGSGIWQAWMNSCDHHTNIDDRSVTTPNGQYCSASRIGLTKEGIGAYRDSYNRLWMVQDFARY